MSKTALQLVRELGQRFGEYRPVTVSSAGTTTTIIAGSAQAYYPRDVSDFHAWFYGPVGLADTLNRGLERRAKSWVYSTSTFTFHSGSVWGEAPDAVGDIYDLHLKYPHTRLLQAVNDAVGMLSLAWWRPIIDTTLLTAASTWRYTLPTGTPWHAIEAVLLQTNTDQATYPYEDAQGYGYEIERNITSAGVETWSLQFRNQPPVGRSIKLMGQAAYSELSGDADVLPIGGEHELRIVNWLMGYAKYCIQDWESDSSPPSEVEGHRQRAYEILIKSREDILALARPARNSRIITPMNRGRQGGDDGGPRYLGAFTPH